MAVQTLQYKTLTVQNNTVQNITVQSIDSTKHGKNIYKTVKNIDRTKQ